MTFLKDNPDEDEEPLRAKVVRQIMDHDAENHQQIKFLLSLGDGEMEELIAKRQRFLNVALNSIK